MDAGSRWSRRTFLVSASSPLWAGSPKPSRPDIAALRRHIVNSPVDVALHRAQTYTRVFQTHESRPWIVRKGLALREHLRNVPLYVREHDRIAGSIAESPGAMPLIVEIGIGENNIYTGENPPRQGYLKGKVPAEIWEYWRTRSLQSRFEKPAAPDRPAQYKFISCQGHLSPSYRELLEVGFGGLIAQVRARRRDANPGQMAFLEAAEDTLTGASDWAARYGELLAKRDPEMARIARKVSSAPPETFREALQLLWFAHQVVHIEGHGYSCTPDHLDQILWPFYERDRKAGRLDDAEAIALAENFVLKQYDNTYWGPEHHLTQGLCCGGSTPDGQDLTNRLSWIFIEAATNLSLPEPLVWVRWHPRIDQEYFDFCLSRLERSTCFPMFWNDKAIPDALMELGVARDDAFRYIPVGCNELAIPGQFYFNPGANANYLGAIQKALGSKAPSFPAFTQAVGVGLRESIQSSYDREMKVLRAQMELAQTPFTSCFFDGCVARGQDMILGTKYNHLTCGGVFFANAVDSIAAIREVVYEKREASLAEVAAACKANFQGYERLRAKLLAAPKHGNDDPRVEDIIRLVEELRDRPMKEICRDPRDGSRFGNGHVVRSSAVRTGRVTGATPDGRLAGTPLAASIAAAVGCERNGPTALLNSVTKLNGPKSWQGGYQVNVRFQGNMVSNPATRAKIRAMANVYFERGGQELQINVVDTETLRAAQKNPAQFRDLVVRIAGFSEFFVNLTPDMQEEIINRTAHS